ncbi:MAG: hypothetical protein H0T59_08230 [Chloroflexi bacterium]|nr:hypothetical protein [Chloroflexota bacterium]
MIELLLQAERALSVGLLDRADVLYSQVAKADPRNSIAVVGLARVTLDRGDDVGALELARKALAIDPENTAAQRMVARLEEVLDFRDAARDLDPHPAAAAEEAVDSGTEAAAFEVGAEAAAAEAEPEAAAAEATEPAAAENHPSPTPEPEPASTESSAPEPVPAATERPPEPAAAEPMPSLSPAAEPPEPRRRSWLDRLLGRP